MTTTDQDQDREAFEATFRHLNHDKIKDGSWPEVYIHPHVESIWHGWQAAKSHERARAASPAPQVPEGLRIVFDGFPAPEGPRFVEVEDASCLSVQAGEWRRRPDGLCELVLAAAPPAPVASHEPAAVSNNADCVSSVGDKAASAESGEGPIAFWRCEECGKVTELRPAPPPEPAKAEVRGLGIPITDDVLGYIARYGGRCRDCGDTTFGPICDGSGLPCGERRGIEHVLRALNYGLEHGYISALSPPPTAPAAARSAAEKMRERCLNECGIKPGETCGICGATRSTPGEEA